MQRVAFIQWLKAGSQGEYVDAHRPENIWPDLVRATQEAGAHNYTGFIGGPDRRLVVGYLETEDLDGMMRELVSREVNTRWASRMGPLVDSGGDLSNGSMEFLTPIWRIE